MREGDASMVAGESERRHRPAPRLAVNFIAQMERRLFSLRNVAGVGLTAPRCPLDLPSVPNSKVGPMRERDLRTMRRSRH